MIPLTSEQDKAQLKKHALELLEEDNYEGLVILVDILKETDFRIKSKNEALRWAAVNGELGVVKQLTVQGANINSMGDYALRWSLRKGHLDIVKYLVEHGADVNTCEELSLRYAEENGHAETAKYLREIIQNDSTHK